MAKDQGNRQANRFLHAQDQRLLLQSHLCTCSHLAVKQKDSHDFFYFFFQSSTEQQKTTYFRMRMNEA